MPPRGTWCGIARRKSFVAAWMACASRARWTSSVAVEEGRSSAAEAADSAEVRHAFESMLRETHTEVDAFGRTISLPAALQYTRRMYVSYVDDELLVVKDESGIPDILLRKAKPDFIAPDEGVPSTDNDDLAPGAG